MTIFWITAAGLAVLTAAFLALGMFRARTTAQPAAAFDLQVYRDQLKEVERDLARGVINEGDADRIRTEVSRRILAADSAAQAAGSSDQDNGGQTATGPKAWALAITAIVVVLGGFGLYTQLGSPGYGDLALADRKAAAQERRANRPSQSAAEAQIPTQTVDAPSDYLTLVERLRSAVEERPDDIQGLTLLSRSETALGNFAAAYAAQSQIISAKGDAATAQDYADLAGGMVAATGGYVSPEAERALEAALARDETNGTARYYAGLMMAQVGRPDSAFALWRQLLREGPADAPWIQPIREQIEELAFHAGQHRFELPPLETPTPQSGPQSGPLAGPTSDDVAAASEMTAEERQTMIRGMVDGLSERLATEGGTPQEWARLIGALGVLGDTERAAAIWDEAQVIFAETPEALAAIRAAAAQAGLTE